MKTRLSCLWHKILPVLGGWLLSTALCPGVPTPYSFGNPTAEEQRYIEYVNRARAYPTAEGVLLATTTDPDVTSAYSQFAVNLDIMKQEFAAIGALPPLAPNASLTTSARNHSAWMLANATQSHDETNPANTFASRIAAAGYTSSSAGENIYAYCKNVWFGHAGLEVDWGTGTGSTDGMQNPRGHRANIHSSTFREIGVGVTDGTNGAVGPQLVTQDLGLQPSSPTFATGVAYYDLNSNGAYDIGEGIAGLTVNVSGATSYYCTTATGGGWVVPIPTSATTRTVTFTGLNANDSVSLVVAASTNAKADLKLTYTPPAISSPSTATAGSTYNLAFAAIRGATAYKWNRWSLAAAAAENCESTANITSSTTGTYAVLNTSVKQQGNSSFHLENSTGGSQSLQLGSLYYGQTSPSLSFQSQIRYATSSETFKVQIKEEGGTVWQDVFSQTGSNGAGEASFTLRTATLTGMANKAFRIRFLLNFTSGSYYPMSGDNVGWFIDAISFTNVSTLQNNVIQTLAGTTGSFTPSAGSVLMSVTPVISGLDFPASYQTLTVSAPAPTFLTWAAAIESSNSLASGTISSNPSADYDHDGRSNLLEYAFGSSPVIASDPAPRMPVAYTTVTSFGLQYQIDTSLTDLTFTPQAGTVLGTWNAPGETGAPNGFTDAVVATYGTIQTHQATVPLTSGGSCYMRVRVTRP